MTLFITKIELYHFNATVAMMMLKNLIKPNGCFHTDTRSKSIDANTIEYSSIELSKSFTDSDLIYLPVFSFSNELEVKYDRN